MATILRGMLNQLKLFNENFISQTEANIKKDYPTLESMMYHNKDAKRYSKKKKAFKNKPFRRKK